MSTNIMTSDKFRSGFITLVGRSNVGKSTLLNTLVGTKIAAVTDKPQTTRNIIHGVLNFPAGFDENNPEASGQAVFIDTPGVFKEHHNSLSGKLTERVREALHDIDMILYVADPSKSLGAEERYTLSLVRNQTIPKILVINKSDLPDEEKPYLEDYRALSSDFNSMFELSALHSRHVQPLKQKVFELLPPGEPAYPENQLTNIDERFWVAELIREKIFKALRKEVPYATHVEVTNIELKSAAEAGQDAGVYIIDATIYTSDSRYKKMIIGAGGRAIKEIGIAARKELEAALNKKVYLNLEVETDKHWQERV